MNRIYYLCPDQDVPTGGIKILYRHVDILNRSGFDAAIVHKKKHFRCTWFANSTRIEYFKKIEPDAGDVVVVPEVYGPRATADFPRARKVIFAQGAYVMFIGYSLDPRDLTTAYRDPNLLAVLVVSEDSRRHVSGIFPEVPVRRLHISTDVELFQFRPLTQKKRQIAFMPRKNIEDARQVINILKFRGALQGWDVVPVEGLSHPQVAALFSESALYFSFNHLEGCPLPPLEAMLAGALVIGNHGNGAREYFQPEYSWPIAAGDIMGYVTAAEEVLRLYRENLPLLQDKAARARAFVETEYAPAREERDVRDCWRELLAVRGPIVRPALFSHAR